MAQTHLAMIRFHNRVVDTQLGGVPAAQQVRQGARDRHEALPVDDPHATTCRGSASAGVVNDVFNNGRKAFEVGATPTDVPDDADRVLGRRLPARPLDGARRATTGTRTSTSGGGTLDAPVHVLGDGRNARRRDRACRPSGSRTGGGCTTSARRTSRTWPCRRASSTARCGSTRRIVNPLRTCPPQLVRRPNATPGNDVRRNLAFRNLDAREDGQARHRPADGDLPEEQGRERDEADARRRSGTATTAPTSSG